MLIGNLTRDPELRYTPSGTAVCSFRLATNRSWTPSDGSERKEETEFHRIVAWNKLAELCSQLLSKGRKVYIEGRLQTRSWETPEGEKKYTTEVVAEDMVVLDSRRTGEERPEGVSEEREESEEPMVVGSAQAGKSSKKAAKVEGDENSPLAEGKAEAKKGKGKKEEDEGEIDVDDIPF
jgi:single-strand DNA-binding protein